MYRKKLLDIGIPANLDGFEYLNCALKIYAPGKHLMPLYSEVAEAFKTTAPRVERSMRTAVSKLGKYDTTVGEFIAKYKILWEEEEKK